MAITWTHGSKGHLLPLFLKKKLKILTYKNKTNNKMNFSYINEFISIQCPGRCRRRVQKNPRVIMLSGSPFLNQCVSREA